MYGDWEGMVHPSGIMYYFTWKTKTYTGTDIKRILQEDAWFLVVEPIAKQDGDHYEYYCVDTSQHIIAWFYAFDASLLFQECAFARKWNHKRLELEAQFWKHVDFFPRHYKMRPSDAAELRAHLEWFLADSNPAESHLSSNDFMTEQGVAFCGRIWSILQNIHVDGIVNSLDIRQFIDRFNDDNVKHSTLVRAFLHIEIRKLCVAAQHFGEKMKSLEFASQNLNDNRTRVAIIYSAPSFLWTTRISRRNICNPRSFFNDDSVVHNHRDYPRRFLLLVYTGTEHASLHKFVNIDTQLFGTKPSSVHSRMVLPSLLRSLKYLRLTVFKQIFQFLLLPSLAIQVYGMCSASDPGLYGL
ncbi:hypothetical protein BDR06DRAFT_972042 [Suillus hirtellus]|nr:hypothetical protein BDR06DRAFT_972042 [Suillus hirtellus]